MDGKEDAYRAAIEEISGVIREPNITMASARRSISRIIVDLRKLIGEEGTDGVVRVPTKRR